MRLITFLFLVTIGTNASAQLKGFGFGPYVERAWPAGDQLKNGLGAGVSADIRLPGKMGITGSAGYIRFGGKQIENESGSARYKALGAFPLRAGLKFRPLPFFYFKVEGGAARITGGESAAILSPGIGMRLLGIDLQAKYEKWYDDRNTSFWGLKLGLNL